MLHCCTVYTQWIIIYDISFLSVFFVLYLLFQLRNEGYTGQLDGMDRNPSMLKYAKAKGIYTNIWTVNIGPEKIKEIDDGEICSFSSINKNPVFFPDLSKLVPYICGSGLR